MEKPGIKTSEFWLAAIGSLAVATIGVLIAYGVVTQEQAAVWQNLVTAIAAIAVPVAIAWIGTAYTKARTSIKTMGATTPPE